MLSIGIGGYVEGWVAKLVARLLFTASSLAAFEHPNIHQKIINGCHKQKSGKHTISAVKISLKREMGGYLREMGG